VLHDQYLAPTNQVCTVSASRINVLTASQELGWVYKYSEKKAVKSGNPWRIRHTGIYHVHDRERSKTTLIILNPSPAAHFALHLRNILQQAQARAMIVATPMLIHAMLISSHLSSWREYLEHHETLLLDLVKFSPRELVEECITNYSIVYDQPGHSKASSRHRKTDPATGTYINVIRRNNSRVARSEQRVAEFRRC
jgi:hypothetical protein